MVNSRRQVAGSKGKASTTFSLERTLSAYRQVLANRQARPFLIIIICGDAIFLSYLTQAAYLLEEYLGVTRVQFPLVFAGFVVCLMIANRCNAYLLRSRDSLQILRWGLYLVLVAATVLLFAALSSGQGSLLKPAPQDACSDRSSF